MTFMGHSRVKLDAPVLGNTFFLSNKSLYRVVKIKRAQYFTLNYVYMNLVKMTFGFQHLSLKSSREVIEIQGHKDTLECKMLHSPHSRHENIHLKKLN